MRVWLVSELTGKMQEKETESITPKRITTNSKSFPLKTMKCGNHYLFLNERSAYEYQQRINKGNHK